MSTAAHAPTPDAGRRSYALERFIAPLTGHGGLHIFDFGGANQANLDFLTSLGHRVYCEDLLVSVDYFFSPAELDSSPQPERIERFLAEGYQFPDQTVDGALLWDTLQFMPIKLAEAFIENTHRTLAPESHLLALFSAEGQSGQCAPLRCRIQDERSFRLEPRAQMRAMSSPFSNRAIERLFSRFSEIKFFLTREHVREVIVRR